MYASRMYVPYCHLALCYWVQTLRDNDNNSNKVSIFGTIQLFTHTCIQLYTILFYIVSYNNACVQVLRSSYSLFTTYIVYDMISTQLWYLQYFVSSKYSTHCTISISSSEYLTKCKIVETKSCTLSFVLSHCPYLYLFIYPLPCSHPRW